MANYGSAGDLVNAGYHGYQGWGDTEAVADYKATGGSGKGGPTSALSASKPSIDIEGIYNSAFNSPEIQAQNERIRQYNDKIGQRRTMLAQAQADINDNPFYSEATRVGRSRKLDEKAQADIGNLINETDLSQRELTTLKGDAENKVNIAMKKYDISRSEYQDKMSQLNMLITSGALTGADEGSLSQISRDTGIAPSMLQSIINTQRAASESKPELQTFDDGTNQFVVAIDSGGNVINKQVVGQSKPTKTGGGSGTGDDAKREANFYKAVDQGVGDLKRGESWGNVWNRVHLLYPEISNDALDSLLGTGWRESGAYESYHAKTTAKATSSNNDSGDLF